MLVGWWRYVMTFKRSFMSDAVDIRPVLAIHYSKLVLIVVESMVVFPLSEVTSKAYLKCLMKTQFEFGNITHILQYVG